MTPTDEQLDSLVALVRGGAGVIEAASHLELDPLRFERWLRRNRAARARVERALAQAELADAGIITVASKNSWQAARARTELRREREGRRDLARLRELTID